MSLNGCVVRVIRDVTTHHSLGPLVHDLDEARLELLTEVLKRHVPPQLAVLDVVGDAVDCVETLGELGRDGGL